MERIAGWDVRRHIIDKQTMDNEIVVNPFHENSLLAVKCGISIGLHPSRNMNMPSSGCLLGAVDAFNKLKT
jgi:hypothetical protein